VSIELRVTGGQVYTAGGLIDADLLVSDGKVTGIVGQDVPADAARTVDATGQLILPGMIDVHVHLREPGFTHKEDTVTATSAAAAGGVTTVFGMPNLDPATTTAEALADVLDIYSRKSIVNYNHNPAATDPAQLQKMADQGIRAYKIYMVVDSGRTYPHPPGTGMHDHGHLLAVMDEIAKTGLRFIIHPHDQALMNYFERQFLSRGENTPAAYAQTLAAREGVIWDSAVDTILRLAEASNCPVHIAHMQTRRSIEAVRRAKQRGTDVTCEVNHWALFLSKWEHVERLGPYALSYWIPDDARAAVWDGLRDGTIDMCSSDHAPHTREEKEIGWEKMWSSHTGTPGIQYYYPLLLDAVRKGEISLDRVVDSVAGRPARAFGLSGSKGTLLPGKDADFVIADLNADWTITNDGVLSKCGWTPYDGVQCGASITATYVRGSAVFTGGKVTGVPGQGHHATA
jgi:dihydroorotase (multifunctional complex type)